MECSADAYFARQFNLIRCLLGAVSVSVIQLINNAMGPGWSFVTLSGVCLLGTPLPLIVLRYGPRWRVRRVKRAEVKEEKKRREERERLEGFERGEDQRL